MNMTPERIEQERKEAVDAYCVDDDRELGDLSSYVRGWLARASRVPSEAEIEAAAIEIGSSMIEQLGGAVSASPGHCVVILLDGQQIDAIRLARAALGIEDKGEGE